MTSTLNVWINKLKKPCEISDKTWYITIYHCNGPLLDWCGRKYIVIPAKCGYASIKLPPGKYKIGAVWNYHKVNETFQANHFTDSTIVNLCCGQTHCITLFNPVIHRCGQILNDAINDVRNQLLVHTGTPLPNPQTINEIADIAIRTNNEFLAMARLVDNSTGPMYELDDPVEFDLALKDAVICSEKCPKQECHC